MTRPDCPCFGCGEMSPTCKRECDRFKKYEADYKEFETHRQADRKKKDASMYKSSRREKFYRNLLLEKKKGKKI